MNSRSLLTFVGLGHWNQVISEESNDCYSIEPYQNLLYVRCAPFLTLKCISFVMTNDKCIQNQRISIRDSIWAASWQNQQSECAPSEDSEQPGHSPSLIRVFAVHMKKAWTLSYPLSAQRRLWSDWADVFAGRTTTLLVLSRGGSFCFISGALNALINASTVTDFQRKEQHRITY